jgi:hypothetical protein
VKRGGSSAIYFHYKEGQPGALGAVVPTMAKWAQSAIRGSGARTVAWSIAFAVWLGMSALAFAALTRYAGRAEDATAESSPVWPAGSKLPRAHDRATLVMVAHPKCGCTRASLRGLERTMARSDGRLDAFVVFVGPYENPPGTGLLDLRAMARAIPGVRVVEDAAEAQIFGARTSGQVYLYDAQGALRFRGGLTAARGHEGGSVGGDAIHSFLVSAPVVAVASAQASDVFGCALFDRNEGAGSVKAP